MAKRKAAKASGRKKKAAKRGGSSRPRAAAKRASAKKAAPRRSSGQAAKKAAKSKKKAAPARKARPVARKAARKAPKRVAARKAAAKAPARKAVAPASAKASARPRRSAPPTVVARKTPALNRARRTVTEEDLLPPSPPSSLDMDRSASAARSGRREMNERIHEHNETGPVITAGDVDADWESAYSVGDEAPGGDNPTPDQDVVDDIGKALGVQYEDNEELKGEKKISDRDKKRWELDPASAEDYGHHEED